MSAEWRDVCLEDCMEAIIDYRGKTPKKTTSGVPLITAKIVKDGRLESPFEYIAENDYLPWMRRGFPKVGDVVMTTEAPLGEVAQLSDAKVALAQRVIILRGKPGVLDNTFLKFLFRSARVQERLHARASGSTVSGIRQSELRKVLLPLPTIGEQRAIAGILGALDDKIELNRKVSATLEATARALFKSWFVDFDSVRAKAEGGDTGLPPELAELFPKNIEVSDRGDIPTGWRVGSLGDIAMNERRGISHTDIIEGTPYIGLEHMPRRSIALEHWGHASHLESNKSQFMRGEFLFGKLRPYFHKVGVAPIAGVCSTDILVISAKSMDWSAFLLMHLSSDALVAHTDQCSTGTKMPRASWDHISGYEATFPPAAVAQAFNAVITPMTERILAAIHESRTLAAIRDALLPKLISGEHRLNDAERILEQSA